MMSSRALAPLLLIALIGCPASAASAAPAPTTTAEEGSADELYRATFHWLAKGLQAEAEQVLYEAVEVYDRDPRLLFFAAACVRSRFDVPGATAAFQRVVDVDPDGAYGRAAKLIVSLDNRRGEPRADFAQLQALIEQHPDDPLLLWMAAVQCRALDRNPEGVVYYERLARHFDPGPVHFHQTFANVLDEVGRHEDALAHRRIAVRQQPATWSYQGTANTLTLLGRWEEADALYAKITSMTPRKELYWQNWSWSMTRRGDREGALEKIRQGLEHVPTSATLHNAAGNLLRELNRPDEALAHHEQAMELAPRGWYAYQQAARALDDLCEPEQADQMRQKSRSLRAASTRPATRPAE